jgi:hypothetical protein
MLTGMSLAVTVAHATGPAFKGLVYATVILVLYIALVIPGPYGLNLVGHGLVGDKYR